MKRFLKKQNYFFETNCQLPIANCQLPITNWFFCFSFLLLLVLLKDSLGNYDCEEDGIIYRDARFNDAPPEHRQQKWGLKKLRTDTWQECQKACAAVKECKGFMWYKDTEDPMYAMYAKACQFFSTWTDEKKDTSSKIVSGLVECEY